MRHPSPLRRTGIYVPFDKFICTVIAPTPKQTKKQKLGAAAANDPSNSVASAAPQQKPDENEEVKLAKEWAFCPLNGDSSGQDAAPPVAAPPNPKPVPQQQGLGLDKCQVAYNHLFPEQQ